MTDDWSEDFGKYTLKKIGSVYSCSCPSWRFQYAPITLRSCKHLIERLGYDHEFARAPQSVNKDTRKRPKDSETTNFACGPMSYRVWRENDRVQPSRDWLWSKKLNGIFVRWQDNKLWTKRGRRLLCPSEVTKNLPQGVTLDAELYAGKDSDSRQLVRLANSGDWTRGTPEVCVFDLVDLNSDFKSRYQKLVKLQEEHGFRLVKHHLFGNFKLVDILEECLKRGEEGVVLRNPGGMYDCSKNKRQSDILKAKPVEVASGVISVITEKPRGTVLTIKENRKHEFKLFVSRERSKTLALGDTVYFAFSGRHGNETPENATLCNRSEE